MLACVSPLAPSQPQWLTSTTTTITFIWDDTIDDGGCPVLYYKVFRDTGNGDNVINQI